MLEMKLKCPYCKKEARVLQVLNVDEYWTLYIDDSGDRPALELGTELSSDNCYDSYYICEACDAILASSSNELLDLYNEQQKEKDTNGD